MKKTILRANPQYGDYYHHITLNHSKGKITLGHGDGQCPKSGTKGKFELILDDNKGILKIKDSYDYEPWNKIKQEPLDDRDYPFTIEYGDFYIEQFTYGGHLEHSYPFFKKRYIFDKDPVWECGGSKHENIFYDSEEGEEISKTSKELIEEGVIFEKKGYFSDICSSRRGKEWKFYIDECRNFNKTHNIKNNFDEIIEYFNQKVKTKYRKEEQIISFYSIKGKMIGFVLMEIVNSYVMIHLINTIPEYNINFCKEMFRRNSNAFRRDKGILTTLKNKKYIDEISNYKKIKEDHEIDKNKLDKHLSEFEDIFNEAMVKDLTLILFPKE